MSDRARHLGERARHLWDRGHRRALYRAAATLAVGLVGALAAVFLAPPIEQDLGTATISAAAQPGSGATVVHVPPLGTVVANTHTGPLTLNVDLATVNLPALAEQSSRSEGRRALLARIERDLRSLATKIAAEVVVVGLLGGAVAAALVLGRDFHHALRGGVIGVTTGAMLVGSVALSYDVEAFEEPRFTGALRRAPTVIAALRAGEISIPDVRSRFAAGADRLSELLTLVAEPASDPRLDTVAILHISDIHSNPLGIEVANQLVRQFRVDAVLDTGDLTNFGLDIEANIGRLIDRIDVPYIFVPGNHDSARNQAALGRVPNVRLLHGEIEEIEGIRILGWRDPTYTNWNNIPVEEADAIRIEEGAAVAAAVDTLRPDVLAVHDARMALESYGKVPLVLAGHDHKQAFEVHDGTTLLKVGSTGATGFKFFVESDRPYEAQVVYFQGPTAVAVDYVRFSGLGSDFEIQRRMIEPIEEEAA